MIHDGISPDEFLSYVHDIDLSFMKEDKVMRNELEKLDMENLFLLMEVQSTQKIF